MCSLIYSDPQEQLFGGGIQQLFVSVDAVVFRGGTTYASEVVPMNAPVLSSMDVVKARGNFNPRRSGRSTCSRIPSYSAGGFRSSQQARNGARENASSEWGAVMHQVGSVACNSAAQSVRPGPKVRATTNSPCSQSDRSQSSSSTSSIVADEQLP